jgi:Tannase and feruloyl esterase
MEQPRATIRISSGARKIVFIALLTGFASIPAIAAPNCATLTKGLAGNSGIKSANGMVVAAAGRNSAYCQVNLLYGTNPDQNINVRVGLPLNSADGGSGGVQGAWNGRTEGLGGGGCSGNLNVTPAVNAGYVGSGTDLGHSGGNCEPGVNADGTYSMQFIQDFIRDAIEQQVIWAKKLAADYYGEKPAYNYWNGCSTGGRQGYLLAQEMPEALNGIVADSPAIYWTRFQTAQMWGQIVMKELVGHPIAVAKLAQAQTSAVAACDAADGVTDGIIDDPRSCHFRATANTCGSATAPAENCLTPNEAAAIDKIWDGPRNARNQTIWFGLDRGSDFRFLDGPFAFPLGVTQFHWDEHNRNFDWQSVTMAEYGKVAQDGSRNIADTTDTVGPLDQFKHDGGKLITYVGANDQLIYPRGVINYYRQMAVRYGHDGKPDYQNLRTFYRLFRAPGVGHCGLGSTGPVPADPFGALVKWVEHGVAPDSLLARGGSAAPASGRTRPVCAYPETAIYNGTGNINDASSFHCGGDVETPKVVCSDVLVRYKHEANGKRDYKGTGVTPSMCRAAASKQP